MKKLAALIMIFSLIASIGYAEDAENFMHIEKEKSINLLKNLEIVSEEYIADITNATRIECLTFLLNISGDNTGDIQDATDMIWEYTYKTRKE